MADEAAAYLDVVRTIALLDKTLHRIISDVLAREGFSGLDPAHGWALFVIGDNPSLGQTAFNELCATTNPAYARRRLTGLGLARVAPEFNQGDKRRAPMVLTEKGERLYKAFLDTFAKQASFIGAVADLRTMEALARDLALLRRFWRDLHIYRIPL